MDVYTFFQNDPVGRCIGIAERIAVGNHGVAGFCIGNEIGFQRFRRKTEVTFCDDLPQDIQFFEEGAQCAGMDSCGTDKIAGQCFR